MRIAELAELTGVTPRQLRHFEARGLLSPARDDRGWRDYDERDRMRVEEINRLVSVGIPTELALRLLDVRGGRGEEPSLRGHAREDASGRSSTHDEVLADILVFYGQLDARARCLARNRDALEAWLHANGVYDVTGD